ncbi:uncharacterized protein LOC5513014 [Nematostella vectensis]|uniref:uncharacterized protein LOC5513014 n=1 Tax=Nematostella vectensis TaxID=45351 RepID=UPI002077296F|nr:uncharacterized protein LOC5513014 [Nematostella vectensis]
MGHNIPHKDKNPSPRSMGRQSGTEMYINPTYLEYRAWLNDQDSDRVSLPSASELHIDGLCRMTEDTISMTKSDVGSLQRKSRSRNKAVFFNALVFLFSFSSMVVTALFLFGEISSPSCGCGVQKDTRGDNRAASMQKSRESQEYVNRILAQLQDNLTGLTGMVNNQKVELEKMRASLSSLKEKSSEHADLTEQLEKNTGRINEVSADLRIVKSEMSLEKTYLRSTTAKIWSSVEYLNASCTSQLKQTRYYDNAVYSAVKEMNETFNKKVDNNLQVIHEIKVSLNTTKQDMEAQKATMRTAVAQIWTGFKSLNQTAVNHQHQMQTIDATLHGDVMTLNQTFTHKANSLLETIWAALKTTSENLQTTFDAKMKWALNQTKMAFEASMSDLKEDVQKVNDSFTTKVSLQELFLLNLSNVQNQTKHRVDDMDSFLASKISEMNSMIQTFWLKLKSSTEQLQQTFDGKLHWALNQTRSALNVSMTKMMGEVQDANSKIAVKVSMQSLALQNLRNSQLQSKQELTKINSSVKESFHEMHTDFQGLNASCSLLGTTVRRIGHSITTKVNNTARKCSDSTKNLYETISNLNGTLTLRINNISKLQGPPGPPGSRGPPGITERANSSIPCKYMSNSIKVNAGMNTDVVAIEKVASNKKIVSPYCTSDIARVITLSEISIPNSRVFKCDCVGKAPNAPTSALLMTCYIHYYECPLVIT